MALPLDGADGGGRRDSDEVEGALFAVQMDVRAIGGVDLRVGIGAGHDEVEALQGCEKFEFNDAVASTGRDVVNLKLDRVGDGPGPEILGQPFSSLRGSFGNVSGGQDRNRRGAG